MYNVRGFLCNLTLLLVVLSFVWFGLLPRDEILPLSSFPLSIFSLEDLPHVLLLSEVQREQKLLAFTIREPWKEELQQRWYLGHSYFIS